MIQIVQVSKNYSLKYPALSDINLEIGKGEFVFIYGPSGAGKTTLLKLIFGIERPTRGEVIVNGVNLRKIKQSHLSALRQKVGFVFQDFRLLNYRTVFENVALALEVTGTKPKEIKRKVQRVLKHVGLLSRINILPPALSGGEQQRVAIARAIVNEPALLLADEPTGNLDAELTKEIIKLFKIINAWGTTIVIATHDHNILNFNPTKVVVLERGKIKEILVPKSRPKENNIFANIPYQN